MFEVVTALGGTIFDYTHGALAKPVQVPYACVTAPTVVRCEVSLNGVLQDAVYAGAGNTHSWWANAGGPLLNSGHGGSIARLQPNDHLVVTVSGPAVFRIDLEE